MNRWKIAICTSCGGRIGATCSCPDVAVTGKEVECCPVSELQEQEQRAERAESDLQKTWDLVHDLRAEKRAERCGVGTGHRGTGALGVSSSPLSSVDPTPDDLSTRLVTWARRIEKEDRLDDSSSLACAEDLRKVAGYINMAVPGREA